MVLPAYLGAYANEIFLVLTFFVGLLLGLAIKKGIVAIVLIIVAFILASFIGLPYFPVVDYQSLVNSAYSYSTVVHFTEPVITFGLVIFAVGVAIGVWKG